MASLGLDFVKLGLQDVLFNPENGWLFTPNMGLKVNINDVANGVPVPDGAEQTGANVPQATPDPSQNNPDDASGKEKPDEDNDQK